MCAVIIRKMINVKTVLDDEDLVRRKRACADFRKRLKSLCLSSTNFARLTGYSKDAVHNWQSLSDRCVPPHPAALRFLFLFERDRGIVPLLEKLHSDSSQ